MTLTPSGRALKEKAQDVQLTIFRATQCSADEIIAMKSQLERLRARLRAA